MSEYATIEHYVNHVMDEITKRDVEQVSERLHALGWEEVVYCRDCKEFSFGSDEYATADWCDYWDAYVESPDGFCKWGERRDE